MRRSYAGRDESRCQCPELPKVVKNGLAVGDERPCIQFWEGEPCLKVQQVVNKPGCLVESPEQPLRTSAGASHRPTEPIVLIFPLARKSCK